MRRRRWLIFAVLAALAAMAGSAVAAAEKPAEVVPIGPAALKKAIAADKGRVVVVDFWATWCIPCEQEFPALVRLSEKYKASGLVVIAVSADSRKDLRTKVLPFVRRQRARFPLFLQRAKDPQDFINAFDPNWYGDLPKTFVYDRSGRLVNELSGGQTDKSLAATITPLLHW